MEMLEIERELAGPAGEEAMRRYDGALVALAERVKAFLRAGGAPEEYRRCETLGEAVTVARKLLRLQVRRKG